ncbi:MAG: hypothetical protein GX096_08275 [Clostridiales bacterium]|nr:hypothetical protein [Clostridiales bacterium]
MKKLLSRVISLTLMLCLLLSSTALAQSKENIIFYEEASYPVSIASYHSELYILRYDGLFRYDAELKTETLITDELNGNWQSAVRTDSIMADETGLYGFISSPASLTRILDENGELDLKTMISITTQEYPNHAFLQDGKLYILERGETEHTLRGIPLQGGEMTSISIKDVEDVYACGDNQILVETGLRHPDGYIRTLQLMDLTSGDMTEIPRPSSANGTQGYDRASGCVYHSAGGELYRLKIGQEPEICGHVMGGDKMGLSVFGDGLVAMIVDSSLVICDTKNPSEQTTLVLQHPYGRGADYEAFITENPNISLRFGGDLSVTPEEEFAVDMTTKSSDIDIYLLSDLNMVDTIYTKSYGEDLSGNSEISALVDDMYTPFSSLFKQDGKIFAFPQSLWLKMVGYAPKLFEANNLEPPTTYGELFDQAQLWLDEYAEDSSDYYYNLLGNDIDLMHILKRYADECIGNGKEVVFDTPELAALIQRYLEIAQDYSQYDRPQGDFGIAYNIIYVPHRHQVYGYLPLAINPEHEYVISGADIELGYFVINPYSQHKEEAEKFLLSTAKGWTALTNLLLLQSKAQPILSTTYESEKAHLEAVVKELEAAVAASSEENAADLKNSLTGAQWQLEDIEDTRWEITEAEVSWYQEAVHHIVINKLSPLSILEQSQPELLAQLEGGSITPQRFLSQLDDKIRSIYLEAE